MRKIFGFLLALILCVNLTCAKKGKLTFMHFWTSDDVRPTLMNLVQEFEKANPGFQIEMVDLNWSGGHDKITISFATNTAADLIELGSDWVPEYASRGLLYDLTKEAGVYRDSLLGWEASTIDGKIYGFPWMLGTRIIFYNKDLMQKAGLNPQHPPQNWDQLYEYSLKINHLGAPIYGFGSNAYEKFRLYKKFLPFLWSNGGDILSPQNQCLLNSAQAQEALEFYAKLTDSSYLESQRGLDDKFVAGELGFIISGDWLLRMMQNAPPKFQVGACLIPPPDKPGAKSASFLGGEFLTINANSPRKKEALQFIKFLVSKEPDLLFNQAAGSVTPANLQAAYALMQKANPLTLIFLEQIKYARPSPVHPRWVEIQSVIEDMVQKAIYHKGTISEIINSTCMEVQRILNE